MKNDNSEKIESLIIDINKIEKNKKILFGTTTAYTGSLGTICSSKLEKQSFKDTN